MELNRKKGNPRMNQLKRKKVEAWFGETSFENIKTLAEALNMPVAKLARRAMNYFARGGVEFSRVLKTDRYD